MKVADNVLTALFIPSLLLCAVNFFYPLYFSVNSAGEYARADKWYLSQIYLCMALFIVILELFFSKAPRRDRWVAASFAAIPLINQLLIMCGKGRIPFTEDEIYQTVSYIALGVIALWTWWKNNSFTQDAIAADIYLDILRKKK